MKHNKNILEVIKYLDGSDIDISVEEKNEGIIFEQARQEMPGLARIYDTRKTVAMCYWLNSAKIFAAVFLQTGTIC